MGRSGNFRSFRNPDETRNTRRKGLGGGRHVGGKKGEWEVLELDPRDRHGCGHRASFGGCR